jgi:hypothetical protein
MLSLSLGSWRDVPAQDQEPEHTQESPQELRDPAERASFMILPLRIHRLKSEKFPAANCNLSDADFERILGKMNRVWSVAGISFGLDSIREEQADVAAFEELHRRVSLLNAADKPADELPADAWLESRESQLFRALIPRESRKFAGFRLYYIHEFNVNGIYFGNREGMVKATARLSAVPGGIDEPLPRVSSHELGHGLGLPHRQHKINLMASGTTGTSFIADEIKNARAVAEKTPGMIRYSELAEQIAKEENQTRRARLQHWQAQVEQLTPQQP